MDPHGEKICPVCKKKFLVNWADQWAYKRTSGKANVYFCSWKCLREMEKKGEEKRVRGRSITTRENEAKAVDIALDGGDPLRFLEECGCTDASQKLYRIKLRLKEEDPDTYEKLPKRIQRKDAVKVEMPEISAAEAMDNIKDAADEFFDYCESVGLMKAETPERPKILKPLMYDGMTVRAVSGSFWTYYHDDQTQKGKSWLDVSNSDGDELSMTVENWRIFLAELKHAAEILGVEL